MSYDLRVWATDAVAAAKHAADLAELSGRGWQIVVNAPDRVEEEDIPEEIRDALPGIVTLIELNLSPISAPKIAHEKMWRLARQLAKLTHGIVEDPQSDEIETPQGVQRLRPVSRTGDKMTLTLNWWFTEPVLVDATRVDEFLDLLSRQLPEALPKRYGLYEPPPHRLEETGRTHLRDFLLAHLFEAGGVVWYPHPPMQHLHLGLSHEWGATQGGYRANHFYLDVDAAVLSQPGWQTQLKRFWRAIPSLLHPFYGDVRLLRDRDCNIQLLLALQRRGSEYLEPYRHPICGPWFAGIPVTPPLAMVLGPCYRELWPEAANAGKVANGYVFVDQEDWTAGKSVGPMTGPVPTCIAQQSPGYADLFGPNLDRSYPEKWPLGKIYDEKVR